MIRRNPQLPQHEAHAVKGLLNHAGWAVFEREALETVKTLEDKVLAGELSHDEYVRYTASRMSVIDVLALAKSISKQAKESQGA